MPVPVGPLGTYVDARRKQLGLSWRKLSYRAGVSPETIAALVKREGRSTPRAETLRGLARALDCSYEHLLQLAGHLDPPGRGQPSAEVKHLVNRILDIYQDISHDPEAVRQLVNVVYIQAEAIRTLAGHKAEAVEERQNQNEHA